MSLIKAIVGGLLGAAIATAVLIYLRGEDTHGYDWFPVVTGVLTGLGVRLASGTRTSGSKYLSGGVAALIALAAILGSEEIISMAQSLNPVSQPLDLSLEETTERRIVDSGKAENVDDDRDRNANEMLELSDSVALEIEISETQTPEILDASEAGHLPPAGEEGPTGDVKPKPVNWRRSMLPYLFSLLGVLFAYELGKTSVVKKVSRMSSKKQATTDSD
jgi:hypothetical protein